MTEHIHSCGYHCDIPACVKDQRDKLVNGFINALDYPNAWDVVLYPSFESALKEVYAHFKSTKHAAALQELVDIAQEHDMGYGKNIFDTKEFNEMVKKGTEAWKDTQQGFVDYLRGGKE